jgi:hypothetical protein
MLFRFDLKYCCLGGGKIRRPIFVNAKLKKKKKKKSADMTG